jgi:hypothetical protein
MNLSHVLIVVPVVVRTGEVEGSVAMDAVDTSAFSVLMLLSVVLLLRRIGTLKIEQRAARTKDTVRKSINFCDLISFAFFQIFH